MSKFQIRKFLRSLFLVVLSTLLMLSYQNCQGLNSTQLESINDLANAPIDSGEGTPSINPDDPNDDEEEVVEPEPEEPEPTPITNLCHDKNASEVDWDSGYDFYNIAPHSPSFNLIGNLKDEKPYYKSSVDRDTGSRLVTTKVEFVAEPGQKGLDYYGQDISNIEFDSLAEPNCSVEQLSGEGTMQSSCNLDNGVVNVRLSERDNQECVYGTFRVTVSVTDTCSAARLSKSIDFEVENICPDMGAIDSFLNESDPKPEENNKFGETILRNGNTLVVSAEKDSEAALLSGAVYVYNINNDNSLDFVQKIMPSNEASSLHALTIDMNSKWLIIPSTNGKIRVYKKQANGSFSKQMYNGLDHLTVTDGSALRIGFSVALMDDYLVVGTNKRSGILYGFNLNSGAIALDYHKTEGSPVYNGYRMASFKRNSVWYLVTSDREGKGSVYIEKVSISNGQISLSRVHKIAGGSSQLYFGDSFKVSDNFLAVGEDITNNKPRVKIYSLADMANENAGTSAKYNLEGSKGFGSAIEFSENEEKLYIGNSAERNAAGEINVWTIPSSGDLQAENGIAPVKAYRTNNQQFGASIVIKENRLFVGVPNYGASGNREAGRVMFVDLNENLGE
ncbi:MAG: hypothetical protein VX642_16170 [Bdellovibrionota bacterium]|nr:hypothetical protein [Bdellovibrionota bacterium]